MNRPPYASASRRIRFFTDDRIAAPVLGQRLEGTAAAALRIAHDNMTWRRSGSRDSRRTTPQSHAADLSVVPVPLDLYKEAQASLHEVEPFPR